jgi:hypothetical protein
MVVLMDTTTAPPTATWPAVSEAVTLGGGGLGVLTA